MLNLGDIAMLQVCIERLRRLIRPVKIQVITSDPERLLRYCPDVTPVPAAGSYEWFGTPWSGGPYSPLLPARARDGALRGSRLAYRGGPRCTRAALRAELLAREPVSDDVRAFLGALVDADAVVVSGRGGTADVFRDDGLRVLEMLQLARGLGAKTAMVGQGLGPVEDDELRARAAEVLPTLDLIAVRDRAASLELLERCRVTPWRVTVTGDDALAAAFEQRPQVRTYGGLGIGLRLADYAAVTDEAQAELGRAVNEFAARHGTEVVAIPISLYAHEADGAALARLTGADGAGIESPLEAIRRAGVCRVVVAGSYHAAVFALGQGVPVVALSASDYYDAKLRGLADLFPGACTVVRQSGARLDARIRAAVEKAWADADDLRPVILAAAEEQIAAGNRAYERLAAAVGATPPAGSQATSNGSTSGSVALFDEPAVSAAT
jgi:colanic acid/amylovoran biosynthesis protein